MSTLRHVRWLDLGLIDYEEAFAVQEKLHGCRRVGPGPDFLLFQENFPVITMGKSSSEEHLLFSRTTLAQKGLKVLNVSRGGDVSYHGPGQMVVSPVLQLKDYVEGVHQYVRLLEQVVINLLSGYGVPARRLEGTSGVWVGNKKIGAVGIAVKEGITQHGVAINVNPDLEHFKLIIPCGIKDKEVSSLQALDVPVPSMRTVRDDFVAEFSKVFCAQVEEVNLNFMGWVRDVLRSNCTQICRRSNHNQVEQMAFPGRGEGPSR